MARNLEQVLPQAERERVRAAWMAEPGHLPPLLHLGFTTVFGAVVMAVGACLLREPTWGDLAFGLFLVVLSNATEWRIHRDLLHRRRWPFHLLYDRHTPQHHLVFVTDDMPLRSAREFRMVLVPPYAIVFAFAALVPLIVLIDRLGHPNLAAVFAIETMGYLVSYEWLHLAYHLPESTWIGSRRLVAALRRHHALHHDPRLMQKWNFNVSLPLWDLVRRTWVRDGEAALEHRPASPPSPGDPGMQR